MMMTIRSGPPIAGTRGKDRNQSGSAFESALFTSSFSWLRLPPPGNSSSHCVFVTVEYEVLCSIVTGIPRSSRNARTFSSSGNMASTGKMAKEVRDGFARANGITEILPYDAKYQSNTLNCSVNSRFRLGEGDRAHACHEHVTPAR